MPAGDAYAPVAAGQPIQVMADFMNDAKQMVREWRAIRAGRTIGDASFAPTDGVCLIQNNSTANTSAMGVLGIAGSYFVAADSDFANQVVLSGDLPTFAGEFFGWFVVTREPIAAGGIGRAFITGICPVTINVVNANHGFADIKDGDTTQLESCTTGAAQILYKESGTGSKNAIVLLGTSRARVPFDVTVSATSGSNGNGTTQCSRVYTVTDLDGHQLGTGVSPEMQRPNLGKMADATGGLAYFDTDKSLVLVWVDEQPVAVKRSC